MSPESAVPAATSTSSRILIPPGPAIENDLQFTEFATGAERARRVIPEPFFVHSHLTTGVQLADLIAYIAAWGMQVGSMDPPARPELAHLGNLVAQLEHHSRPPRQSRRSPRTVHSFYICDDLRPHSDRNPLGQ